MRDELPSGNGTATVHHCTISGNAQGGMTSVGQANKDIRYNYWGDPSGPGGVGYGYGDSVGSAYLIFDPWLGSEYAADFAIREGWATNRVVPPHASQAYFWASATAASDWTFQVIDSQGQTRYEQARSGERLLQLWNCLDSQGQALPAGRYTWRVNATRSDDPQVHAAPLSGAIEVKADAVLAEIHWPREQNETGPGFGVVGTVDQGQRYWVLRGGPGEAWITDSASLPVLAQGSSTPQDALLTSVDLSGQPKGRYVLALEAYDPQHYAESRILQCITVNHGNLLVSPNPFSPNGDGEEDTVSLTGEYETAASWTLAIKDSAGSLVRSWNGESGTVQVAWDGRDQSGVIVADGDYDFLLVLHGGGQIVGDIAGVLSVHAAESTVDMPSPADGFRVSNLEGSEVVTVRGSIAIPYEMWYFWKVEVGAGENPASWTLLAQGQARSSLTDYLFYTWTVDPAQYTNGTYRVRLSAQTQYAETVMDSSRIEIANFLLEIMNPSKIFNPSLGETAAIRVHVGQTSEITVDVYRLADSSRSEQPVLVRRLAEQQPHSMGTYDFVWDGRDGAGQLVPDWIYAVSMSVYQGGSPLGTVGDGARAFYEVIGPYLTLVVPTVDPPSGWYPLEEGPATFTHGVMRPCIMTLQLGTVDWIERLDLISREFRAPGTYVTYWDGTGGNELFPAVTVGGLSNMEVSAGPAHFNNLVGLYGNTPRVMSAAVGPPTYSPGNFDDSPVTPVLSYSLDRQSDVTIELVDLATGTVMRTWSLPGQAAGAQELEWAGTLEDGTALSAGDYRWRITASANGLSSSPRTALMRIVY